MEGRDKEEKVFTLPLSYFPLTDEGDEAEIKVQAAFKSGKKDRQWIHEEGGVGTTIDSSSHIRRHGLQCSSGHVELRPNTPSVISGRCAMHMLG